MTTGQVARGDVLALPGQWAATATADCRLRCLDGAPAPLRGRGAYLLYAGAAETAARLQPLDATEVRPGGDALVRLHLERPLVLDVFEPLVLRDSGRDETVGGGLVLDPFPPAAVRGTAARLRRTEELEAREAAGRSGLPERVLAERGVVSLAELPRLAAVAPDRLPAALAAAGAGVVTSRTLAWARTAWEGAAAAVVEAVARSHRDDPSAPGLPAQAAGRPPSPGLAGRGRRRGGGALVAGGRLVADGRPCACPATGRARPGPAGAAARVEAALDEAGVGLLGDAALAELGADRKAAALLVRLGVLVPVASAATSAARPWRRRWRPCAAASPTAASSPPPRPRRPSAPPAAPPSPSWSTSTTPASPSARATCAAWPRARHGRRWPDAPP